MTIATQQVKQQYQGNGTTTVFAIPYPLVTPQNLSVTLYDSVNFVNITPNPVLNGRGTYDFTFFGKLDTSGRNEYVSQNQITFNNPPPSNYRITIIRGEPYLQDLSLSNSVFNPPTMEGAGFDNAIFQTEQLFGLITQCLQGPVSDTAPLALLPPQELRAGSYLAFDANGQPSVIGGTNVVTSWNGRIGIVTLQAADLTAVGGALLASPAFSGVPTAPTPAPGTSSTQIATTAFVAAAFSAGVVTSFNTRVGAITLQAADVTGVGGALLASPTFTGVPAAPTAAVGTNTSQLATTQFVESAVTAILASPTFTGVPTAPTASVGTNTTQLATCAFVQASLGTGVTSFNTRVGAVVLQAADVTGVGGALLASPTFTGVPAAPTATPGTSTTQLATTAFVQAALPLASSTNPVMNGTAAAGSGTTWSRADHVHPSDTSRAPLASPTFTGTPAAPTATAGTSSQQIATTAFVQNAVSAYLPLSGGTVTGTLLVNPAAARVSVTCYNVGQDAQCDVYVQSIRDWRMACAASNGWFYTMDVTGSNAYRFEIDTSGNTYNNTGVWSTSDPIVKADMRSYTTGLAAIRKLNPITFRYNGERGMPKDDEGTIRVGLDATATRAHIPEAVHRANFSHRMEGKDNELDTLNTAPVLYALINAVKELADELDEWKRRRK